MTESGLVLLVEDNELILDANQQILTHDGYTVLTATTLREARKHLNTVLPDVTILDIMLPDGNGLDFMAELRRLTSAPVLFLTAKDKQEQRLDGLMAGGNDYITKPYDIAEFRARVKNFMTLQRGFQNNSKSIILDSLMLDMVAQQAFLDGKCMHLPPKEFALLHLFVTNVGRAISVEYIYEKVWGQPMRDDAGAVKTAVSRLRTRLDDSDFLIVAQRGVGYCFER